MTVPDVHDGRPAASSTTLQTSKTVLHKLSITLTKGARVLVTGRLRQRSFETKEGEKRTVVELDVDDIGPSLKYATAKVNKVSRSNDGDRGAGSPARTSGGEGPWGNNALGSDDEPPF